MEANDLRNLLDRIRTKLQSGVILLGSVSGGKPVFIASVSQDLINRGANAGELAKEMAKLAGGGGGGKADMAQAGGKEPEKLEAALEAGRQLAKERLSAS